MFKYPANEFMSRSIQIQLGRFTFLVLGGILCGLLSYPVSAGALQKTLSKESGHEEKVVRSFKDRSSGEKRRDPFKPMKKRRTISSSSGKAHSVSETTPSVPKMNNPQWKLMGIIQGRHGREAVIQVASKKRVFIRAGLKVLRSGWMVTAIRKREVLFEYSPSETVGKSLSEQKVFILSFSNFGNNS